MIETFLGILGGGIVSYWVTHYFSEKQIQDLKRLHRRQLEAKRNFHEQQLSHDRDVANLILRSMRYKMEHPELPLPLIDQNMMLRFEVHSDTTFHLDKSDHLFSWDEPIEAETHVDIDETIQKLRSLE